MHSATISPNATPSFLRKKIHPKATPALFISKRGAWKAERRLGPHDLGVILKRIDPRFNPSKLRDACGIHMLEHEADPRIVADLFRTGIHAIDRLLEMSSAKSRARLMKSHPRATLPQTGDTTIDGVLLRAPRRGLRLLTHECSEGHGQRSGTICPPT